MANYLKIEPMVQTVEVPHTPAPQVETQSANDPIEYLPSEMKEPYLIEVLNIGIAKDHFEMPRLIKEINDFVLVESQDTKESYKEVIDRYLQKLNLPNGVDVYSIVEKLAELIGIDRKLIDIVKAKDDLLDKPIHELTSEQLLERIDAKKIKIDRELIDIIKAKHSNFWR